MRDANFEQHMHIREKAACCTLVVTNFLGNKDTNYRAIVLTCFASNLGDVSEQQGERFLQGIKEMERTYQGRLNVNMITDYCWMLKRDDPERGHNKKSTKRSIDRKRKRFYMDF